MQHKSVFVAVEKSTKAFAFLITAENKERAEKTVDTHPDIDSRLFQIMEPTLILSDQVNQNQLLDDDPWRNMGQGMEYTDAHHPSNY